ncbi:MAG: ABC transporter substrate-binding protein [Gammaproteobacteria bacterium]|nr:ABC transporter substrate-binding protein [Gammaproteobacteria bacterium]
MRPTILRYMRAAGLAVLCLSGPVAAQSGEDEVTVVRALAEFGEPALPPDFAHYPYADPAAPKGGEVTLGAIGSFDSLNSLPLQGEWPRNIGLLTDTLMAESQAEISVYYPLIAESVEFPEDRAWAIFNLRPEARFHDGTPITAEDVVWSFDRLKEHARPFLRAFYEDITAAEALGPHRVRFTFATRDTLRPVVRCAILAVYPRHWWTAEGRDIGSSTLEPPLGSGPYRLVDVEPGRSLAYERVEDYWAADLPVRRGLFNFDRVTYEYYTDSDVMFEAFKAGAYDFRHELTSRNWATGYEVPAVDAGRILLETVPSVTFRGMQGYFFNTRLAMFADARVREALAMLYPFDWVNRTIMYGLYDRIDTWFLGAAAYQAQGIPEGRELELLEPYRDRLPAALFVEPYVPPGIAEDVVDRRTLRRALALLREAGWHLDEDGTLVNVETGRPMAFELLLRSPSLEPHTQPFIQNLARLGIEASVRWVDSAQFLRRYQDRDFAVISFAYTFFPPPGEELVSRFGAEAAAIPGTANLIGVENPVVDGLIAAILDAGDLETIQAGTRALDRVLLWNHYAVPHWYKDVSWIAYWDMFDHPEERPVYDYGFPNTIGFQPTWSVDADRAAALDAVR